MTEPTDDREARFHALIAHAVGAGELFDRLLIAGGHTDPLPRDDMPAFLLWELEHLLRLQFDALCHDLDDPWLSHAAPTHLRPVLEGMCHIAFVLGHETDQPVGTAQQRATCLALARGREAQIAQAAARPGSVPEGNVEEARLRVQFYEKLHERVGCPFIADKADWPCRDEDGAPCRHRQFWPCTRRKPAPRLLTTPTTERLSSRMSFPFRDLEQASSLVLHLSLIDRMVVDTGQGTNAFAPPTYVTRASNVAMGISAYGPALWWVMDTIDRAAADVLRAYIASTWRRSELLEIQSGAWDR